MKKFIIAMALILFCFGALAGQDYKPPQYTYFFEITSDTHLMIAFDMIKAWIAKNNHYSCRMDSIEEKLKAFKGIIIVKLPVMEKYNYTLEIVNFYMNGKKIELLLSDNPAVGLTNPYSQSERDKVFERFYDLYRWNIKGEAH